jgi:hypothetical protein
MASSADAMRMQRLSYTCIVSTRDRDEVHANMKHCHVFDNVIGIGMVHHGLANVMSMTVLHIGIGMLHHGLANVISMTVLHIGHVKSMMFGIANVNQWHGLVKSMMELANVQLCMSWT